MDAPQRKRKVATYGKSSRKASFAFQDVGSSPEKAASAGQSRTGKATKNAPGKKLATSGTEPKKSFETEDNESDMSSPDELAVVEASQQLEKPRRLPQGRLKSIRSKRQQAEDLPSEQLHKEEAEAQAARERKAGHDSQGAPKMSQMTSRPANGSGKLPTGVKGRLANAKSSPDAELPAPNRPGKLPSNARRGKMSHGITTPDDEQIISRPGKLPSGVKKTRPAQAKSSSRAEEPLPGVSAKRAHADSASSDDTTGSEKPPKSLKSIRHASPGKNGGATSKTSSRLVLASRQKISKEDAAPKSGTKDIVKEVPAHGTIEDGVRVIIPSPVKRTLPKPAQARSAVSKGVSAPAKLHDMLPSPESKPSSPADLSTPSTVGADGSESHTSDSVPTTPPKRTSKSPFGSVTPRQNKAWSNLLGDTLDSASPSVLSFDQLNLATAVKPRAQPGLLRSSSDIPQTTQTRRARLIDTLKQNTLPSSDVEDESTDSVMDLEEPAEDEQPSDKAESSLGNSQPMDIDSGSSQSAAFSQSTNAPTGGPKVTYARTRSYLQESSLEDELMLSLPMDPTSTKGDSGGFGAVRPPPLNQLMEEEDETSNTGFRSRHELRAAGGARRMDDEMEALIDEVKDTNPISGRRNAMFELCTKLKDKAYISRMTENGLDRRFFTSCATIKDTVLGFTFACAVSLMVLSEIPGIAFEAISHSGSFDVLKSLLDYDADINRIAKERRTNMSRIARESLSDLREWAFETLWKNDDPEKISRWVVGETESPNVLSPRVIALKSMELLIPKLRQNGAAENLIDAECLSKLSGFLEWPVQMLCGEGHAESPEQAMLNDVLSILEYPCIDASVLTRPDSGVSQTISGLAATMARFVSDVVTPPAIERKALGFTYNLTINNPAMCELFATESVVQSLSCVVDNCWRLLRMDMLDEEGHRSTLARLTLASATLSNLAENSATARSCFVTGEKTIPSELVNLLVRPFLDGVKKAAEADSTEATETIVGHGELTVALGHLCQHPQVREMIQSKLPHQRLDALIGQLEEFKKMHMKVDARDLEGDEHRELYEVYGARLQRVIDRLKFEAD